MKTKPPLVPTIHVVIQDSELLTCEHVAAYITNKLKTAGVPIKATTDFEATPAPLRGTLKHHRDFERNETVITWRDHV